MPTANSWQLSAISKLHFKTCALDATHRHAVCPAPFFEQQVAVVYARQPSGEGRLAINRFGRHHFGQPPLKSPVVRFVPQRSIEAWRRNLEGVRMADCAGLEILFFRGPVIFDIFTATRDDPSDPWSTPVRVDAPISSEFNEQAPRLSKDGQTLFFSSNRPGTLGDLDIWMATREKLARTSVAEGLRR